MNKINKNVVEIFNKFLQHNEDPKGELFYINNFTLLIAVVMSAQMTDAGLNKVTKDFFQKYNTPQLIVELGLDKLTEAIKSINYYKTKAKNVYKLSQILLNSEIPSTQEGLLKLPGVGIKTANVFLNAAFNLPKIGVDTHVARVSQRLGFTKNTDVLKIEQDLYKIIPQEFILKSHKWLILHGRYICKAKNPQCQKCFLKENCKYAEN
jgi:endonuclease-3